MPEESEIRVIGACQNNLNDVDVGFPKNKLTVVTGVSGSGKSSLVFDTLYAEGQRRYVESFSTYARQFLERMDRPDVTRIDGLLPAVAIEQRNTIRSARSTLGTITELTDYLKLLFAHMGRVHCEVCGEPVFADTPSHVAEWLLEDHVGARLMVSFPFHLGAVGDDRNVALGYLGHEGFTRAVVEGKAVALDDCGETRLKGPVDVVVDRLKLRVEDRPRLVEALELAYRFGEQDAALHIESADGFERKPITADLKHCGVHYPHPRPGHFSFNSPLGACETCNGFGRIIDLDVDRVIPDTRLSLKRGAIQPWTGKKRSWERRQLRLHAERVGLDLETPFRDLSEEERAWVVDGEPGRGWRNRWPGVRGWFKWLERKSYRMHVRIFLARYRAYIPCTDCDGTRFKSQSRLTQVAGHTIATCLEQTVNEAHEWVLGLLKPDLDRNIAAVLDQLVDRLTYLKRVGLGYLALDRHGRTLSGGEVQRANLTTAIGSGLVNTLFVLDEPSVGLHAKDAERLAGLLSELTKRENTVVLVEHDPMVLGHVDHVIELGPGPGDAGGKVIYSGRPAGLLEVAEAPTSRSLIARESPRKLSKKSWAKMPGITVRNARAHNLKGVDVHIPKGALTVVTGVSGSGKSTLMEHILRRGLLRRMGKVCDPPGAHDALEGLEHVDGVIWVDQAPPAASPRANPATYVKAWDAIRNTFARTALAKERGFTAGTFSFNAGKGRCPGCEGAGYEKVEMQFLSDIYVVCPMCEGKRFRPEVLEVTWEGRSIADMLALTVVEAAALFPEKSAARRKLGMLENVGLGYLTLGQPLNTLSGGEAQRLKLAHHLGTARTTGSLFLLDEPTTGLHLEDVDLLNTNLLAVRDAGNTVVVVEHHLDVIAAADHVIDLGPDGGDAGGEIVFQGSPTQLLRAETHTGHHFRDWLKTSPRSRLLQDSETRTEEASTEKDGQVRVEGARVHNLRDVSVTLPRLGRTVVSGVSGSGKSSLALDLVFAEGQRRFLDCLSSYARQYINQMGRPDADAVSGIPPTVAIEQRRTRGGAYSTVADVTETAAFLRLLFARVGRSRNRGLTAVDVAASLQKGPQGKQVRVLAPVIIQRKGYHKAVFARALGYGHTEIFVDGAIVAPDPVPKLRKTSRHTIAFVVGAGKVSDSANLETLIREAARLGQGEVAILADDGPMQPFKVETEGAVRSFDPRLFSPHTELGACPECRGTGVIDDAPCAWCKGERLGPEGREITFAGRRFPEVLSDTPQALMAFMESVELSGRDALVAAPLFRSLRERVVFLQDVGLDYLTLDRRVSTLSGGEFQRIRLAAQLGAHLSGMLYVLDEPTIGLHPSDVSVLLGCLDRLQERGNGVLMVEHDEQTIRTADRLIDVGPGAGHEGGEILVAGPIDEALANPRSITGQCLKKTRPKVRETPRSLKDVEFISLKGIRHHNIEGADVAFPVGRFTTVAGVSGSGKSSLANDVLARAVDPLCGAGTWKERSGGEGLKRVVHIDDKPIGKNPRSTPATYVGLWDKLRKLFAQVPEARLRGYTASRFSFNVKGGRCESCAGQGVQKLEMSFLPDAIVTCPDCGGKRFGRQTLHITYQGYNVHQVLELTVRQALEVFEQVPSIRRLLELMDAVGLGYLPLGQASPTLSGGEAQRIKLVRELHRRKCEDTLILMDEPTTGLHLADVPRLIAVMHRLVDQGATVVVIEHHSDVIREGDWVIDMGPGGGVAGGTVVYQGPVAGLLSVPESRTGPWLEMEPAA